jgi:hypothetical protein
MPTEPPPQTTKPLRAASNLEQEELRQAQQRYVDKYDKLVTPDKVTAMELLKLSTEYGKLTLTSLIFGNGGGLATVLAIYPLIRDSNQIWLAQQLWVAVAFVVGLFLAVVTAAVASLSFMGRSMHVRNLASHNSAWIAGTEFTELGMRREWVNSRMEEDRESMRRAERTSEITSYLALTAAILSGVAWSLGTFLLARNLMVAFSTT